MSYEAKRFWIILAVTLLALVILFSRGSNDSSNGTATCGSCGRSYKAGDSGGNFMNIARTHMCKNCYHNFKWSQSVLDSLGN